MAHQSLYRAYRPHTFAQVVGQDQVKKPLGEQISTGSVSHAYLFAGSRGLGKTSIARIFAQELGCTSRDLYEIDAASNNSVDDIRALTENIYTLPFESPYKVYILDEAHMLSKGAWNAFLKTLEEPPAYVIFILATTELSKVPETVQSRCQVYEFKKPTRAVLAEMVTEVAAKEGFQLEPLAADLVALLGDGSYRDSLSVLEKVLTQAVGGSGDTSTDSLPTIVTHEDAEAATGAPKHTRILALVTALTEGNTEAALVAVRAAAQDSIDMALFLSMTLDLVRTVLLVTHAPELRAELRDEAGADVYAEIEMLSKHPHSHLSSRTLVALLDASERMRFSPIPSLPLELAILEVLSPHAATI
jgi:DNA polymerase-3 subunit gamma/tau